MSKKTFKMTTGRLYKEKKIRITENAIELLNFPNSNASNPPPDAQKSPPHSGK